MRRAGLVFFAILTTVLFPSVYELGPLSQPQVARADPALSGAITTEVTNGDFSGVGLGDAVWRRSQVLE